MGGFSNQPPGGTVQSCPLKQKPAPTYWIEIELIGEDDNPIPWEEYEVQLPDGQPVPGFLDGDGFARLENLEKQGTCKVRFPNLDKEAWEKVETLPAKGQAESPEAQQ